MAKKNNTLMYRLYIWFRARSVFSRRRPRSIVNRILWLFSVWGLFVYVLAIASIWWGSSKVIDDNFSRQAVDWVKKLDELGVPIYAADDPVLFKSISDHVSQFPELSYLRYYKAENNSVIAEYTSEKLGDHRIPYLSPTSLERLRLLVESEQPLFINTAASSLALIQVAAPIVIRSFTSDGLIGFDMEAPLVENYKIIGFIELGLDFSVYKKHLLNNILLGSLIVIVLFLITVFVGRIVIRRSLSPLINLRKPLAKLANGNTDIYVKSGGDEEIDAIARALNTTIKSLKSRDEKLRKLANYDSLTGLLNKHNFNIQLKHEINRVVRMKSSGAMLFIDLDQFKYVNDTLGHAAGDHLLIQISELLKMRIREGDIISRFGGDEFTIIARDVSKDDAEAIAASIIKKMQSFVFVENDKSFNIYCSIGVVMIESGQFSASEVFSQADMACFQAKSAGRNCYRVFDSVEQDEIRKSTDISWSKRISDSIEHDGFVMSYQPVIASQDTGIEFYEVLVRMRLDDGSSVLPSAFLPAAERLGLTDEIDYWVIRNAIRKMAECNLSERRVSLAINLSNSIFEAKDFSGKVNRYIKQYDVDPSLLYFEINEQSVLRQIDRAGLCIKELVDLGCHFTLEDFGSALGSYNYLKQLPIDMIKIDGDYIENMVSDPVDQAVVSSMIKIAKTLNKKTMVEYVEDAATLEMVKSFGVDFVQGYYFGEPRLNIDSMEYSKAVSKLHSNIVHL
ncbi:MAG: EAL domain-containing protein [Gammaproteobacteria bacterium]|nr:EAL domain-containing protein [Gammaproteobacteria bacterium]